MEAATHPLTERAWIAACSHRLHRHWRSITPDTLERAAAEIKADEHLGAMDPVDAAVA